MMTLEAVERAKAVGANFVHVTLRGVENTEAVEHFIQDRVDRLARTGPEVLWYEVVLEGDARHRRHRPYSARVTAHLRSGNVLVTKKHMDEFLAVQDVFDGLAQRLVRVRGAHDSRGKHRRRTCSPKT